MSTDQPAASTAPPQDEAAGRAAARRSGRYPAAGGGAPSREAAVRRSRPSSRRARAAATENLDKFLRARPRPRTSADAPRTTSPMPKYAIGASPLRCWRSGTAWSVPAGWRRRPRADGEKILEGLDLTLTLMDSAFQKFGLTMIDPQKGERFDPERHQAMSTEESHELAPNQVLATVQKGCLLNNRLLRPALVIVAKTAAAGAANPPAA